MSNAASQSPSRRTITAMFDNRSEADRAIERLVSAGVPRSNIDLVAGGAGATSAASTSAGQTANPLGFFWNMWLPQEDRHTYAEGLRRGGQLVTVQTTDAMYEMALDILDDEGTIDLDQREASWRKEGWTPAGSSTESARGATGQEAIPIVEENLQVGKREVNQGRVRVRSYVVEQPVQEQVNLREETVNVERRPVDRSVTDADRAFQDRTIEAESKREEAVVNKEARVTEELVVNKNVENRTETVSDTVRRTEVEVDDERGGRVTGTGGKTSARRR